jgi:hypothetical protein
MPMRFAIRFESAKNAAIAPMTQISSSEKPTARAVVVVDDERSGVGRHLEGEREHRLLPRHDVGLALVGGDPVGEERVFRLDAQDRDVRDDAVEAVVRA